MGKLYERIDGRLREFIERQRLFFVATAPNDPQGRINISPKGVDGTFVVVDDRTVAYLDLTGSGIETVAHLRDSGRITLMFCAFEGPPTIVRLHGTGRVVTLHDEDFEAWSSRFPALSGARAVVVVDVDRISDSCGYGVPLMEYVGDRHLMQPYLERKGPAGQADYRRKKNLTSIDGLPGFDYD